MAHVILTITNINGKRELQIGYESDSDAMPHEHDQDHKAAVDAVVGKGTKTTRAGGSDGGSGQLKNAPIPIPISQKG